MTTMVTIPAVIQVAYMRAKYMAKCSFGCMPRVYGLMSVNAYVNKAIEVGDVDYDAWEHHAPHARLLTHECR